jgi:hypothetical protein
MKQQERGIVAKLEFPLPECREEFELASHAMDIKGVLWDFDEWLGSKVKYGSEFDALDEKTIEAVREHFYECLEQRNVRLYE